MNILITGASSGIGRELVKAFAKDQGNQILAIARSLKSLQELKGFCKERYQTNIEIEEIDLASPNLTSILDEAIFCNKRHWDIVVNNAGTLLNKPFMQISHNEMMESFQVNSLAPMQIIQGVLSQIEGEKRCHIVNISSMGGVQGALKFPGLSVYSSSKAALATITECLAAEVENKNVTINALALGAVNTDMLKKAFPDFEADTSANNMADYIHNFCLTGWKYFNGKIIQVSKLP